ncbi:MAG TPA: nucleotide sugar dehydrogenase [Phycisphaerae bacterium]|nr:nucleotide sugar dehydrogenase [Phycisphaerae bacterium]
MLHRQQIERINDRSFVVGIIGMGYVGLPLTRSFYDAGFKCVGFDVDERKIKMLNAGKSYIKHITSEFIAKARKEGRFRATSDFAELKKVDAIIICVPTPLTKMREPDMSYVQKTCEVAAKYLRKGHLVALESTTYPGTTRELMLPLLAAGGLKVERDFFLAFSPEREDPGRKTHTTTTIPKVVGGYGPKSLAVAKALYGAALETVVPVSSCEVAEAAKILENVYRCVNIALVNEMKVLFDRMNINVWEVIQAAATKPFGFQAFYPGPGLGGHCIPIDPFYLTWKAREYGMNTRFIELAGEINTDMPEYVVHKTAEALNTHKKPLNGSKVLVLGLAYKKDVDDLRESPSIEIIELLRERGAKVAYNDPFFKQTHKQREHDLRMKSTPLTPASVKGFDCVLIATDHSSYDYQWIVDHAQLVVDTRNATAGCKRVARKVVKA